MTRDESDVECLLPTLSLGEEAFSERKGRQRLDSLGTRLVKHSLLMTQLFRNSYTVSDWVSRGSVFRAQITTNHKPLWVYIIKMAFLRIGKELLNFIAFNANMNFYRSQILLSPPGKSFKPAKKNPGQNLQ